MAQRRPVNLSKLLKKHRTSKPRTSKSKSKSKSKSTQPVRPENVGSVPHLCPDCDHRLRPVSEVGGVRWECPNPDCEPPPPLVRLTPEMKASMKKPGQNAWNDFCRSLSGKGYSADQLRDMYRQKYPKAYTSVEELVAHEAGPGWTGAAGVQDGVERMDWSWS